MAYGQSDLNENYRFIDRYRFRNGGKINIFSFQSVLQEQCDENGIPVAFREDILKTGSLFNKQSEEILIMYNPDHQNDYLQFLIRITYQGSYAFLDVFKVGGSKNIRNDNSAQGDSAGAIGRKLFNSLSGHNEKFQTEMNYYAILKDCLMDVVNN